MKNRCIKNISVSRLFGLYDYEVKCPLDQSENLTILYGDNGVGKSTLLRIVYFLLSSKRNSGHKTALANIAFQKVEVELSDGTKVIADRSDVSLVKKGGFKFVLKTDTDVTEVYLKALMRDQGYTVRMNEEDEEVLNKYEYILNKLEDVNVLFISDNRKNIDKEEQDDNEIGIVRLRSLPMSKREDIVEDELVKLHNWIVAKAFNASQKGEEKASELYSHILDNITKPKKGEIDFDSVKEELENITQKASSYISMGFMIEPEYKVIAERLNKVKRSNIQLVAKIVYPFITMQKNKLDSLDKLVNSVSFFLNSLNEYMYSKTVEFSVAKGFSIRHKECQEPINFSDLSSGEKQLLLLLSKVMRQSDSCSLIIIDEPEISLNIKWQRKLMESMLYFIQDTDTQMLIATHSFEILSKHRRNVIKLNNVSNEIAQQTKNGGYTENI